MKREFFHYRFYPITGKLLRRQPVKSHPDLFQAAEHIFRKGLLRAVETVMPQPLAGLDLNEVKGETNRCGIVWHTSLFPEPPYGSDDYHICVKRLSQPDCQFARRIVGRIVRHVLVGCRNEVRDNQAIGETLWAVKLMLLAVDFFLGFFNFTLAIRYFNHAGYGLGLPDLHRGVVSQEFVVEVVTHASVHYTIGMRCYYLAIPLGLWLFGATWLLIGSILLLTVLYRLDRTV